MQEKQNDSVSFDQVISRGCGIDVHKKVLVATIRGQGIKEETREFLSFTENIESLRTWLLENKITHVAMESTGVYWKPVFNILEEDFEVILVNARHIKNVPGQKTDKKDSRWIAKLLICGLLKASFIPPKFIRELRDLTRYRRKVVQQLASEKNRVQKILEDGNIKLSSVVSDTSGVRASLMINLLIEGEQDVKKLAELRHGKMHASEEKIAIALTGKLSKHHRFMLQLIKESMEDKEKIIEKLDEQINTHLANYRLEEDIELLTTIPGVAHDAASAIVAEIGNDMSRFPDEKHIASWAGMSPGNNESGGKKKWSHNPW